MLVTRNNKEYQATQLLGEIPNTNDWHIEKDDYIITENNVIIDVRSPIAFSKMYEIIEEPESITINLNELKEYLSNLSTEKDEYYVSDQQLVSDELVNLFNYLNIKGIHSFKKFVDSLQ